ncbi:MAG: CYTH domain-containing protein [Magnetospirillum sp.]|nr:CYTH domain-containing protein [Magnetospirillum sp.]
MGVEIERRYLAAPSVLAECGNGGRTIVQGYLQSGVGGNTRIRVEGDRATLTRKGPKTGCCRQEVEMAIPLGRAFQLLAALPQEMLIHKTRYTVPVGGFHWEVDVFAGKHRGLIIGEVELAHAAQTFPLPHWAVREITDDRRFGNSSLALAPRIPVAA